MKAMKEKRSDSMFWQYRNIKKLTILNPDDFEVPSIVSKDLKKNLRQKIC